MSPGRRKSPPRPKRRTYGTGTVKLRADGRWEARLPRSLDPARRSAYFATPEDAARWLVDCLGPNDALREPFGSYLYRWFEQERVGLQPQSHKVYERACARAAPIAEVPLGDLTPDHFRGLWARLRETGDQSAKRPRPLSWSTIQTTRGVLATALNRLVPELLRQNPLHRAPLPRAAAPASAGIALDEAETLRLLAALADEPLLLAFKLILAVGLRLGELRGLRWGDVRPQDNTLLIERSMEDQGEDVGATKSRKSRLLDVPPRLVAELVARRGGAGSNLPIFPVDARRVRRALVRGLKTAGLREDVTPHDLRHTAGSLMLARGVSLADVSAILGHANPAMTARVYSHSARGRRTTAAAIMAQALGLEPLAE